MRRSLPAVAGFVVAVAVGAATIDTSQPAPVVTSGDDPVTAPPPRTEPPAELPALEHLAAAVPLTTTQPPTTAATPAPPTSPPTALPPPPATVPATEPPAPTGTVQAWASEWPAWPWPQLAQCESGGNPATNTGNGFHGAFQFVPSTWTGHGGGEFAPYAYLATIEQQTIIAARVRDAAGGYGPWPGCRAALGLP